MTVPGGASTCLMVADADVVVRHALAQYLRHCGYRVIEVADSDEALTALSDPAIAVELVLCDAQLGGTDGGFGLKRECLLRFPEIEVVLAGSPSRAAEEAAELCEKGPDLARPYDPQLVMDRISKWRAGRDRR